MNSRLSDDLVVGLITGTPLVLDGTTIRAPHYYGVVVDEVARRVRRVVLAAPVQSGEETPQARYSITASNVDVVQRKQRSGTVRNLLDPVGVMLEFDRVARVSDVVIIRGGMPFSFLAYLLAALRQTAVVHWVIGDAVAVLQAAPRRNRRATFFELLYARLDRALSRRSAQALGVTFVCNGPELAKAFESPRTVAVVSSSIRRAEIADRHSRSPDGRFRLLTLGYVRPEKGIEYAIEALSILRSSDRRFVLTIAGPSDKNGHYHRQLEDLIARLHLADSVLERGYVTYGREMFDLFSETDALVFPSLSEGTPRVLIEARASGVPVVATSVGGIPASVTDGIDGLLVPPRSAKDLAAAIAAIANDEELRLRLRVEGLERARHLTIESFVDAVFELPVFAGSSSMRTLSPNNNRLPGGLSGSRFFRRLCQQARWALPIWLVGLLTVAFPENRLATILRGHFLRPFIGTCGRGLRVGSGVTLLGTHNLELGNDVYIAKGAWINAHGGIRLEDEVVLGPYVAMSSLRHEFADGSVRFGGSSAGQITVGRGTWLAAHVSVSMGADIGRGCIVAANSSVTGTIPDDVLVGGVPGKVVGPRRERSAQIQSGLDLYGAR